MAKDVEGVKKQLQFLKNDFKNMVALRADGSNYVVHAVNIKIDWLDQPSTVELSKAKQSGVLSNRRSISIKEAFKQYDDLIDVITNIISHSFPEKSRTGKCNIMRT